MSNMLFYDTTLRDGEQMPGVVFSLYEKRTLVEKLVDFGVDIIGLMPAISFPEQKLAYELNSDGYSNKLIAATMMRKDHIDIASDCGFEKIILFTSLSDIHLKHKLKMGRMENLENSLNYISYAKSRGLKVYFAGEDSSRADISYLIEFVNNISPSIENFMYCDTMGILQPLQTYEIISSLTKKVDCDVGLHLHNDFGCATANSLIGLEAGANLISGTINGIGERGGNAPLEEIILSLRYQFGKKFDLKYKKLGEISKYVENCSGVTLQRHKPLVGKNAFTHESGIHVDGVLKNAMNYENFDPKEIGLKRNILFGKHSGVSSLKYLFGERFNSFEYKKMLLEIKDLSQGLKCSFSIEEVLEMFK